MAKLSAPKTCFYIPYPIQKFHYLTNLTLYWIWHKYWKIWHKYWKLWVCIYICLYVWVCIQENTLSKELNILFVIPTYTNIYIFHNTILYITSLKLSGHFWILFPCKNMQNFEERIVLKKHRPSSLVRNAIF